ncbi:ACP S-malonyltransferase [Candidatus Margulisiibacteriota bacterium]
MAKIAVVFPGQGSQYVGMGKTLVEQFGSTKKLFDQANEALGFDLMKICFEGPEDELKKTEFTQPAILTVSAVCLEALRSFKNLKVEAVAGHSLGEYTALYYGGAISFKDAVKIVNLRGKFMQSAVPLGEGTMAAIMGLEKAKVDEICKQASSKGVVEAANINSPIQIVISGKKEGVLKAIDLATKAGAKRAIELKVSAPFHSSLMKKAADQLAEALNKIEIKDSTVPVVSNVTADYTTKADQIKDLLIRQMTSSVLWVDSINKLVNDGFDTFIEIGPGKVLTGLIKRMAPKAKLHNISDADTLGKFLQVWREEL